MRLWRQRAASAHVIIEIGKSKREKKIFATQKGFDGASEASGVFNSNETNFDGASQASGVLLAIETKL